MKLRDGPPSLYPPLKTNNSNERNDSLTVKRFIFKFGILYFDHTEVFLQQYFNHPQ